MKIATKLYLNSFIILGIIITLFLVSGYIVQQINHENETLIKLQDQFRVVNKLSNAITTSINNLNRIIYNNDVDIIAKELTLQEDMMADFEHFKAAAEKYNLVNDYNFAIENENKIIKIRNELSRCLFLKRRGNVEEAKQLLSFISQNYLVQFLSFTDDVIYHKNLDIDRQKHELEILKKRLFEFFIGVFVVLLFVITLTNIFISRSIANPIVQLTNFAHKFNEQTNMSLRSNIRSKDEVGILSSSIDQLIENLGENITYTDNIISSMVDLLIVVDANGFIRTVNPSTLSVLDHGKNELIGKHIDTIIAEEKRSNFKLSGSVKNINTVFLTKNGKKIPVLLSGSVMYNSKKQIEGFVFIAHDQTEIKNQ